MDRIMSMSFAAVLLVALAIGGRVQAQIDTDIPTCSSIGVNSEATCKDGCIAKGMQTAGYENTQLGAVCFCTDTPLCQPDALQPPTRPPTMMPNGGDGGDGDGDADGGSNECLSDCREYVAY